MGNKLFKKITSLFTTIATIITLSGFNLAIPAFAAVMDSQVADGDLIRATGDIKVYIADKRGNTWYKRWLVGPQIFDFYGHFGPSAWGRIKEVSPAFRDTAIETNLVQIDGDEKVWRLDNCVAGVGCTKRWIKNAATFVALGYDWGAIRTINQAEANWHTTGPEIDTTSQQTGNLTVTLASDNPQGVTLPLGATRVPLLKFTISGNGTVNSVAVQRYGAGSASDFNNVYLYDGDTRLTTGRSINSTTHMVNFTGLNLAINGSKTLTVVGDFTSSSSYAGNVDGFRINSASDIGASTTVAGNFPIVGNLFSTTAATVGSITIAKSGSLTNPKVGETNAKVAEFQLTAGSSEDVEVRSITLFQVGNISRSNLTNFVLKQGGTTLATTSGLNSSDRVVLTFSSPLSIPKGGVRTLELFADVGSNARAGDTIRFYLETQADLYAIGKTYGYGTTVTSTGYDNSANDGSDASWTTVQAGQVTIAFNGPSTTDYSVQQQDVELFRFNITSQNNIEIRNTRLTLIAGGADADEDSDDAGGLVNGTASVNYTDIKFVDVNTGAVVVGPRDLAGTATTDDDSQSLVFTDVWNVNAGQTRTIKVTADVANFTPANNETITARLDAFQASDIKNLDNNLFVATTDIVPSGNITGNAHNIKTASLTASLAGTPTAQTYINGSKNIAMTGINLQAGTGKDIKVTSIMLTAVGSNSCSSPTNCVLTVKLFDGTTQIGDTKSLTSSNTATFSNLNLVVNKGTTKTIVAKVDLNTLSSVTSGTTLKLNVTAPSDITAQDLDGNTVTNSGSVSGPTHTIISSGTLSASLAPDEIDVTDAHNIIAGKSDVTLAKIRFTAAYEPLKITKLRIKVPAGTLDEITAITLWDGSTKVAAEVTPNSSGNADFNSWLADFIVPKDSSKTLTIKGNLNTISGGADSGAQVSVTLDYNDNFEARGVDTNTVITAVGSSDITGRTMIVRKTVPIVTLQNLPSTTLVSGTNTLLRFRISADSAEQVSIKKLGFTVSYTDVNTATDLAVSSPAIREVGSGSDIGAASFITPDATAGTQTLTVRIEFNSEQAIAAGSYKDYDLRATVSNVGPSDQISTLLATNTGVDDTEAVGTPASTIFYLRDGTATTLLELDPDITDITGGVDAFFIWSDNSAVPHNDTVAGLGDTTTTGSLDWIHGYKVRTIPTDSKVLISPSS